MVSSFSSAVRFQIPCTSVLSELGGNIFSQACVINFANVSFFAQSINISNNQWANDTPLIGLLNTSMLINNNTQNVLINNRQINISTQFCSGTNVFNGWNDTSDSFNCIAQTGGSGGTGNVTVNGISANTFLFNTPGFSVVQSADGQVNITNNATGGGSGGLTTDQSVNTTSNVTFDNLNVTGWITVRNNYGIQSLNSTGDVETGVWLDTSNCWHFGWSIVDCRNQ